MKNQKNTLSKLRTFTFNKDADGNWYLESKEFEDYITKLFRETHTYTNENDKQQTYASERDLENPLDDHTKHPEWVEPRTYLKMNEDMNSLLDIIAGNPNKNQSVTLDTISYGFVCNTFMHYHFVEQTPDGGAIYKLQYKGRFDLPETLKLPRLALFFFDGIFPMRINGKKK